MATIAPLPDEILDRGFKVYSVCYFDPGLVVPTVELVNADSDSEAVELAQRRHFSSTKEVWDRHRLVARIRPLQ